MRHEVRLVTFCALGHGGLLGKTFFFPRLIGVGHVRSCNTCVTLLYHLVKLF